MYDRYLFYDKPIPYKSLEIYPVTMENYIEFHVYVNSLLLDKNSTPDIKIISMSYLRYIFYKAEKGEVLYLQMLKLLLHLVLKKEDDEDIRFLVKALDDKPFIIIDGEEYNSDDFDEIKKIILLQNDIDQIDETIEKEIRDKIKEAEEYAMRKNANKIGSLEDQIICVLISTSLKLEDIYNLTIRKFTKILQRADALVHYKIYKGAEMSGMVKFKDGSSIVHWMSDLTKKNKLGEATVEMEDMKGKLSGK